MSLFDRLTNLVRGMVRSAVTPGPREDERRIDEELAAAEKKRSAAERSPIEIDRSAIDRSASESTDPDAPPERVQKKM